MSEKPSQIINGFRVTYKDQYEYCKFKIGDLVYIDRAYFDDVETKIGVVEEIRNSVFPLYNVYVFELERLFTALHENELTSVSEIQDG